MSKNLTRRDILAAAATTGLAARAAATAKPALLGGKPVRSAAFPSWPMIEENDERQWMDVLKSKRWNRVGGSYVQQFEKMWAEQLGAKHCLATANGTTSLFLSLNALGIGPGDEVIVPPYTFVATVNAVLLQHALPVFVDTDPETFQIDARKIEAAITPRTRCILPVHLGGSVADMDTILALGRKHKIPVVEDACQSPLAEWRHKKVSTLGDLGCFSFQASKNLNAGEGGAVLTNDSELYKLCMSFHNNGRGDIGSGLQYVRNGCNLRMTEFQGALLLSQWKRVEEQARTREQNAAYLTKMLQEIPGIHPARMYEGCTRNAYHLYMLRYDAKQFGNLPRKRFLEAMRAEGIPSDGGYTPLNKEPFLKYTLDSRAYRTIYPSAQIAEYMERNNCPANDQLCQEAVWFYQTMMLGSRSDMEQIVEAVRKIQGNAGTLAG